MACKVREGTNRAQRRCHVYPEGTNVCIHCGHATTHGANFRRAQEAKPKLPKKVAFLIGGKEVSEEEFRRRIEETNK